MPPALSQRSIPNRPPIDPDAQVVLEAIIETREDALEHGRVIGDLWLAKVIRVIKGDNDLREVTHFIGNGSCWRWRPSIGGRGFMFGNLTSGPGGRLYFSGEWFSPAEAAGFSWIRFGEYRAPPPHVAPPPALQEPIVGHVAVPARSVPVNQGCGGNGLGGPC